MKCRDILEKIEAVYPKSAAMSFDNVGLQAGRMEKEVKRIYLALDATDEVLHHAIERKADLLITHHPLIFCPLKSVTDQDFVSRRILTLIQNDISYYAMHTNYDVLRMSNLAESKLHLTETCVLDETAVIQDRVEGIGRVGQMERSMTLKECCAYVKDALQIEHVKAFGNLDGMVARMAVCPGSGKSTIAPAIEKGADVLVTGDIGHHDGLDAVEQGLSVIDAGHYGTEYMFMKDMEAFLRQSCPEIDVYQEETKSPFTIL